MLPPRIRSLLFKKVDVKKQIAPTELIGFHKPSGKGKYQRQRVERQQKNETNRTKQNRDIRAVFQEGKTGRHAFLE